VVVKGHLRKTFWLIAILLIVCTLALYLPATDFDFVNFDDNIYVYDNPRLHSGLTSGNLAWAFGALAAGFWQPLTWISPFVDYEIYGLRAGGFHLTNVVLHVLASVFLFLALACMTNNLWRSGFVAAVFALHPLHVEPVAWISSRKDVLSGVFFSLTLFPYVIYIRRNRLGSFLLCLFVFLLGLMSKPSLLALPLLLLTLDYWPLNRFERGRLFFIVMEKIPFLILSLGVAMLTFHAEFEAGALADLKTHPFSSRLVTTIVSYATYLVKSFFPFSLTVYYPWHYPDAVFFVGSLVLLLFVTLAALLLRQRSPWFLVGWLWFLIMVFPMSGLA